VHRSLASRLPSSETLAAEPWPRHPGQARIVDPPEHRRPAPMDPQKRETQPPAPGRERRRHPRASGDWPVTVELPDGPHQARVRDVSRGGVAFFLDRPIPEMTLLQVEFDLPSGAGIRRIRGTGAVVRCERISQALDHYEVAVFLTEMADPDRATIDTFVEEALTA